MTEMTTTPADVREVILATIRGRLLDDDLYMLRRGEAREVHTRSIAEHALDAARARGASLRVITSTADSEQASIHVSGMDLGPVFDRDGPFCPALDEYPADVPVERLFGDDVPVAVRGMTIDEVRRSCALGALDLLVDKLLARAYFRVFDTFEARRHSRELEPETATVGDLIGDDERIALFTAGLYGEEPPAA
jgi:hypothetical protein